MGHISEFQVPERQKEDDEHVRAAWATQQAPGQSVLHGEALSPQTGYSTCLHLSHHKTRTTGPNALQ